MANLTADQFRKKNLIGTEYDSLVVLVYDAGMEAFIYDDLVDNANERFFDTYGHANVANKLSSVNGFGEINNSETSMVGGFTFYGDSWAEFGFGGSLYIFANSRAQFSNFWGYGAGHADFIGGAYASFGSEAYTVDPGFATFSNGAYAEFYYGSARFDHSSAKFYNSDVFFYTGSSLTLDNESTLTIGGVLIEGTASLVSNTGNIPLNSPACFLSSGSPMAVALPDGQDGQKLTIIRNNTGNAVVTPTTTFGTWTTITMTETDSVVLQFFYPYGWNVLSNNGAVIA